jgi:DNA-binding MarR family transcriptional regulator
MSKLQNMHSAHDGGGPPDPAAPRAAGPDTQLRSYVSYRLDLVSKTARDAADAIYQRECGFDIRQLRVLRLLAETPDQTVSDIVEGTMFERTLVSRLIGDLVRRRLIDRRICDIDARQVRLSLTAEGRALVRVADGLGAALNDDLLSVLTPDERVALDRCLTKLLTWRPRDGAEAGGSEAGGASAGGTDAGGATP